jgi:hypothetical protein
MLLYVRRPTGADHSFEWYVLNGHTRRRASNFFRRERRPAAEREKFAGAARPGQSKSAQAKRHIDYIGRCTPFRAQKAPLVRSPRSDAGPLVARLQNSLHFSDARHSVGPRPSLHSQR